jgi:hypothetical protein
LKAKKRRCRHAVDKENLKPEKKGKNVFYNPVLYYLHTSPKERRYSCNLQIIHGSLRLVSPNRASPLKYLLMPKKASTAIQYTGWLFLFLGNRFPRGNPL